MFNWLHRLTSYLQSQILDPRHFMSHKFWTCQSSALINTELPNTKTPPTTAPCSRPILMYLGHFWHAVLQPEGEHTHVQPYTTITNVQGVVLVQLHSDAASLCKILLHSARVISPSRICHISSCHPDGIIHAQHIRLEIPSTPLFPSGNLNIFGSEKDCRFFHVTQSVNLLFIIPLFSTDERRGWRMGGNVFTVTMTGSVWFMLFIIFLSFLFSSVLCNKSVSLCLLTQFCMTGIDPPALGASSQFITILDMLKALHVFFYGFPFFLV